MNKIKITPELIEILDKIEMDVSWAFVNLEYEDPPNGNGIKIEEIGPSDEHHKFDVIIKGKPTKMKVSQCIRYLFKNKYDSKSIHKFVEAYDKLNKKSKTATPSYQQRTTPNYGGNYGGHNHGGNNYSWPNTYKSPPKRTGTPVRVVDDFKFNPSNVEYTFLSLTSETYPKGHEDELIKFLPIGLTKDRFGNYFKLVGKSTTMFTCHLDTASHIKSKVSQMKGKKDGGEADDFIFTDGTSILGADDKAGATVLLYMIHNRVPGVYYFFMGEERGGVGSSLVSENIDEFPFLNDVDKVVSFDRRNYHSVITSQHGSACCSDTFAVALCNELKKGGLDMKPDPTGVFTDSASFADKMPECTNVSVGYFDEHQSVEIQNITYLEKLAKTCLKVDWEKLPVSRKVGISKELMSKYGKLLSEFKKLKFANECKLENQDGKSYITLNIEEDSIDSMSNDLSKIEILLKARSYDPDVTFDDTKLQIELK